MKEVKINRVKYLLIETGERSTFFEIKDNVLSFDPDNDSYHGSWQRWPLPVGGWVLIGKASDLTEQDWQQIVESEFDTWLNYLEDEKLGSYYLTTAKESGYSLLELHGFKPESTLILKRKA